MSLPIHLTDRFPVELVEQVIFYLSQSRIALFRCSLVSKSWLALSYFYVFRHVHIKQANARTFIELIKSPFSMVGISPVHTLSFTGTNAQVCRWIRDAQLDWTTFSSVRALEISTEMFPGKLVPLLCGHIAISFPLITSLTIQYPLFDTIVTFARMVHQLKHLQELTIVQPQWSEFSADHPEAFKYQLPPDMQSIHLLGASQAGCIVRWIDAQRDASPLVNILLTDEIWESG
ncbi:hypothetical protein BD779DRAFT_1678216 [Infundibulicybe gibba]|nr:hypothetical protein BD779DRAFT_1678216 [Infundibulicybe gibba]